MIHAYDDDHYHGDNFEDHGDQSYHHSFDHDDDEFVQLAKETDTNSCTFSKLPDILGSGQPYEVKIKPIII